MFLSIDIGNSSIKTGIFDNDKIVDKMFFDSKIPDISYYKSVLERLNKNKITDIGIISVVKDADEIMKTACTHLWNIEPVILNTFSCKDIKIKTNEPQAAGMDRIANVYAAKKYGLPVIAVDIGTAVTFDILSKNNEFLGGIIMPGINMQLKVLNQNTSKLPKIDMGNSPSAIGNSTETAILSGVIRGMAMAIDGLIEQCKSELDDNAIVVGTGGHCKIISNYMNKKFDYTDIDLTLKGIKEIYQNNYLTLKP